MMMFNYKGITSSLKFGVRTISHIKKIIDIIYNYFDINNDFPEFEIIIHPDYKKNSNVPPETREGLIILSTEKCDYGEYDYFQQIAWQFSHELVHVCKGYKENRKIWRYLSDDDEEEIIAGGIAIWIIKQLCPDYDYRKNYNKTNLDQCEVMAESFLRTNKDEHLKNILAKSRQ